MIQQFQFLIYSLALAALGFGLATMLKRQSKEGKVMGNVKLTNPNETLMLIFGMGVVMAWVIIATAASYFSVVEQ